MGWDSRQKRLGKRVRGQPETTSQRCQNPGWAEKVRPGLGWRWKEGRRILQVYGSSICKKAALRSEWALRPG